MFVDVVCAQEHKSLPWYLRVFFVPWCFYEQLNTVRWLLLERIYSQNIIYIYSLRHQNADVV